MVEASHLAYWQLSVDDALAVIKSNSSGLSFEEAERRLQKYGENTLNPRKKNTQSLSSR